MYKNKIIRKNQHLMDRVDHLLWLDYEINDSETLVFNENREISVDELLEFSHEDWIEWLYRV